LDHEDITPYTRPAYIHSRGHFLLRESKDKRQPTIPSAFGWTVRIYSEPQNGLQSSGMQIGIQVHRIIVKIQLFPDVASMKSDR